MTEIEWKEQSADLKELFANYTPLKGDTITIWDIKGMNQIFNMSECEFLISEKSLWSRNFIPAMVPIMEKESFGSILQWCYRFQ